MSERNILVFITWGNKAIDALNEETNLTQGRFYLAESGNKFGRDDLFLITATSSTCLADHHPQLQRHERQTSKIIDYKSVGFWKE